MNKFKSVLNDDDIVKMVCSDEWGDLPQNMKIIRLVEQATIAKLHEQQEPIAWVHPDDPTRSITQHQKEGAIKDGGAIEKTMRVFSVPAYAHPSPSSLSDKMACVSETRNVKHKIHRQGISEMSNEEMVEHSYQKYSQFVQGFIRLCVQNTKDKPFMDVVRAEAQKISINASIFDLVGDLRTEDLTKAKIAIERTKEEGGEICLQKTIDPYLMEAALVRIGKEYEESVPKTIHADEFSVYKVYKWGCPVCEEVNEGEETSTVQCISCKASFEVEGRDYDL